MSVGTRRLIWALVIAALAIYSASQTSGSLGFALAALLALVGALTAQIAIRRRWRWRGGAVQTGSSVTILAAAGAAVGISAIGTLQALYGPDGPSAALAGVLGLCAGGLFSVWCSPARDRWIGPQP